MGENEVSINETKNFIKTTLPEFLQVTKMMAYDNTEFSKIAFKKGWIKKEMVEII